MEAVGIVDLTQIVGMEGSALDSDCMEGRVYIPDAHRMPDFGSVVGKLDLFDTAADGMVDPACLAVE